MTTKHHRCLLGPGIIILIALAANFGAMTSTILAGQQQSAPSQDTLSIPAQQRPNAIPSIAAPFAQPQTSLEVPSLRLRRQLGYQQVTVTVTDSSNHYVTNLKEDDFRVVEDGQQRPIGFFRVDRSAPVSLGIIVDCSTSMVTKFAQARTAITSMIDDLDPRDDIFLESFSNEAQLLQPFTLDHDQIIDHLKFLHAQAQTSLYDAVYMGLFEIRRGRRDKRALLVVTDGMDNRSEIERAQVVAAARAMRVLIYAIGIGEEAMASDDHSIAGLLRSDADEVDMDTLNALADETGARAFNLRRVGDGDELSRDCEAISNELRQQYTIAYLSPDPGRLGYRNLRVEVAKHPELSVRVRKNVAVIPPH